MDIALPAVVVAPPPQTSPVPDATDLATDAAFAALLASLVAAQAPQTAPVPVEAGVAAGVAVVLSTPDALPSVAATGDVPAPADAAVAIVGDDARLVAAKDVRPAPLAAVASTAVATDVEMPADPDAVATAAADGDGDGADLVQPGPRPAPAATAERVVPQPVAPPDSARLLAQAVPATATVATAAAVVADRDGDEASQVTTPAAAAAVEVASEVRPAEAPKAAEAPAAPRPAEQVVRVLSPLRAAPDGSYQLGLELRPDGLGRVELDVVVDRGVVHVAIRAESEVAGQLLQRSLGELRQGLADAGLEAGRLGVQTDAREGGRHDAPERSDTHPDQRPHDGRQAPAEDRPPTAPDYADARRGGVDLFL